MKLAGWAIRFRLPIYAIVAITAIAGIVSFSRLPQAVYPNLNISRIEIRAESADLSPTLVQASLTRPIERELQSLPGIVQMKALSTQGAADISVTFDPHVLTSAQALQRASGTVDAIRSTLPGDAAVRVQPVGTTLFPLIGYALHSDRLSPTQLREAAEYDIKPQLVGVPGVSAVSVLGGGIREYQVDVDPAALAARGVTLAGVRDAIAQTNTVNVVGHTDNAYVRSTIIATGMARDASDISAIPIAVKNGVPIAVGSVATVREAPAPGIIRAGTIRGPAVIVNVYAQPGASFTAVASRVHAKLGAALRDFPGITSTVFFDPASLVGEAISSLRDAILIGFALSSLVLFYFLRTWRSALVAGAVIPLTIVISLGLMNVMGQGLNLMTLGGLAIGVGLIIDDAIVVVENIDRHLSSLGNRQQAVERAVGEIIAPMTTSTLTTIVVFAPLSLLSGVPGAFFRALSLTLTVALILSLALALVFTPSLALAMLEPGESEQRIMRRPMQFFERALAAALARRRLMWGAAAAVFVLTIVTAANLGTDFLPSLDEGAFEMTYYLPPGTTLAETRRVTAQIERILHADPAIRTSADLTGHSMTMENTDTPQGQNGATIRATLVPRSQRPNIHTVIDDLQDRIQKAVPDIQLSSRQLLSDMLSDLSNELAPIEIRVYGPQQAALIPIATQIAQRIDGVPGVSGAFSGVVYHNPALLLRAKPSIASLGITPSQLTKDEETMLQGTVVSTVIRNPLTIPVRVRYDLPADPALSDIENAPYVTSTGAAEPLSRLVSVERAAPASDISELNGRQYLAVTAQMSGSNLGAIVGQIKRRLASMTLPPGYFAEIAGSYELQQQSFAQFAATILLSMLLVFLVMLFQFRSLVQPLAILMAIPLSGFGAALLLFVTRSTLNVASLMGLILLVGLIVKNGILLLEYTLRAQRQGYSTQAALLAGGRVRFRPIVMTTLTALLGMLPLALSIGTGGELLQPLAIAVIGGLAFSTAITLFMVPVFFATFARAAREPAYDTGGAVENPHVG
ncbi:MAG TPA: efflux RND transporter permease subunit [Candidatus Baltobacteraceae bacterium]|nr:efflux RND transporter permease subunit [Candidatus Baltobacteraceae bacterium]